VRCRTLVIGGSGNFGARIARALRGDPDIELVIAARHAPRDPEIAGIRHERLDIQVEDLGKRLHALSPQLVVHCVGPFQGQDYSVATAALGAGAHYLDLADGRGFVAEFSPALQAQAIAAQRIAICGASTLPALSSAVVEELRSGLQSLESIEIAIAPGQRAPRGGQATLSGVLSYLGRPFPVWRRGRWEQAWGWMDLRKLRLDIGERLAACCDVPDLALFPAYFRVTETVQFHAALEFGVQHVALWSLAALRRAGLPLPVTRWGIGLNRWTGLFDSRAGDKGGMWVRVIGARRGQRLQRTWQLTAPVLNGPEVPCLPAILLARRFARGQLPEPGAYACIGFVKLAEFAPEFARLRITTRTEEVAL